MGGADGHVRDVDDDGVNDLIVGDTKEDVGGVTDAGRVYVLSGRTLSVLYVIDSPQPQARANFGFFISALGDVNGDAKPDIAAGTDAQDVGTNVDQGRAWVFSGAGGGVLYALDSPVPQASARFGSRIGRAGDVNSDGRPDVIVGASGHDLPAGCGNATPVPADCGKDQGQAFIFSGANGTLLRTLTYPLATRLPRPAAAGAARSGSPCRVPVTPTATASPISSSTREASSTARERCTCSAGPPARCCCVSTTPYRSPAPPSGSRTRHRWRPGT